MLIGLISPPTSTTPSTAIQPTSTLLLYIIIIIVIIPQGIIKSLVSGVLPPSRPTTICDLPYCNCDQKVYCRCTDDMQSITLRSQGFDHLPDLSGSIKVENCSKVSITKKAIIRMNGLRVIHLQNIKQLELEEESLTWDTTRIQEIYAQPGIEIKIINCTIPVIPTDAFQGHISSILFDQVTIENIRALAFSNLAGTDKIEFHNCDIGSVESQSFKKFLLDTFIIEGGNIDLLPSYSLISVTIRKDLKLENVNFGKLRSSAFRVDGPTVFRLQGCRITNLEGDAFRVVTKGPVFIDDNILPDIAYGAFTGITLDTRYQITYGKQEMIFENNTINQFQDYALLFNTTGLKPKIDRIIIDKECKCTEIKSWINRLVKFTDTSKVPYDLSRLMWCKRENSKVSDSVIYDFEQRHCSQSVANVYWIISVLIVTLIVLIILCSIGFWLFRKHSRRYMNVPTNESVQNRLSVLSTHNNHVIIIPEGKTYRETELHVIEERLEPIKEYIPPTQEITQTT